MGEQIGCTLQAKELVSSADVGSALDVLVAVQCYPSRRQGVQLWRLDVWIVPTNVGPSHIIRQNKHDGGLILRCRPCVATDSRVRRLESATMVPPVELFQKYMESISVGAG